MHRIVIWLRCEEWFIRLGKRIAIFNKLVPVHSNYMEGDVRKVTRAGVLFELHLSDYMQWFLFIDSKDISVEVADRFIEARTLVLDIGSNIGHFSLKLAQRVKTRKLVDVNIFAFEPSTWVTECFQRNISFNKEISAIIRFQKMAVGSMDGQAQFISGKTNSGGGHFVFKEQASEIVNVVKLDTWSESLAEARKISFIKIDVEGYEPEVFDGAWLLIKKQRPVIFFEFSPVWYRSRGVPYKHVLESLNELSYVLHIEIENQLAPLENIIEVDKVYQTNILAIPQEKLNE